MSERLIKSEKWIRHNINVSVYVPVPGSMDKAEAPAMGDSPMERDENIMKFVNRLSDYFFVLARFNNYRQKQDEYQGF